MSRLLFILAHPDDESLGFGGTIAKYAKEGAEVYLITATRGQRGRFGTQTERPAPEIVGSVREQELRAAASILGIKEVTVLEYMDGDVDKITPSEIIPSLAAHIRRIKPQIILTFGPDGVYGHPDHIAISQFTSAAIVQAADANFKTNNDPSHQVLKLYFLAWPYSTFQMHQKALKEFGMTVDGARRLVIPYPEWLITTRIDAYPHWKTVWRAISCHETQMSIYSNLKDLSDEQHRELWGAQTFYRVFSLVNGGRMMESDLFDGIN
ncbi:MAG TPA: PIG-L family deacetylase [Cyclobacteriaceae bacterium]|nr:PIG-L family deacetylase [Cyclobacteriaceae bacterium]